ncbi:sugar isomerase (SIS) [Catenulispora acidiphila DSM 44928]|uniref:Sugar isomerase (SIS) n=1 Tax=Catenulispora acidiphila (strain DSM 44928 / JCM 14897 / NBRC 102108 / NRRL B-24433 / ID139908) TaxID=479433 RepID=C7PZP0_CATAD|nr:sugar isomerase [Catenulispora acidiphila]ACU73555.1 sugar isomerase (SIS) [Catenulispora acidiphila DSM 44928]
MSSFVTAELADQPRSWQRAADLAATAAGLPEPGERVAVVGCGTSWFMAQAYAGLREASGAGETDAFTASELPGGREYDRVLALSRSGTTTEVLDVLAAATAPTTLITGVADSPAPALAGTAVVLDFADERSVVQTRFATTTLILLRAHLGEDVSGAIADAASAVSEPLPEGVADRTQFTFLGAGWTTGLAAEAALKMREAALAWSESYPAMDYRHGPIAITDEQSAVWMFGAAPDGLAEQVGATGGMWIHQDLDPLASLVQAQRLALELAVRRGLDPDAPRHLTRSVILRPQGASAASQSTASA